MARADDLRAYVTRDRSLVEQAKRAFWLERRRRLSPVEKLRIGDELRRFAHAARPDWPSEADRAADLEMHTRVSKILRAAPPRKR